MIKRVFHPAHVFVIVLACVAHTVALGDRVSGEPDIIDADTIAFGDQQVRLFGIDAPEFGQRCNNANGKLWRCGKKATERLRLLIQGEVTCVGDEMDEYDRLIAVCTTPDNIDLGGMLVREGLAWAFTVFSDDYVADEQVARAASLGIWQADNQPAWEFRAESWANAKLGAPKGCPIKGNISDRGKIYHPPWSPWYTRTKINVKKGERWFCTEREAIDAGWRAPAWR